MVRLPIYVDYFAYLSRLGDFPYCNWGGAVGHDENFRAGLCFVRRVKTLIANLRERATAESFGRGISEERAGLWKRGLGGRKIENGPRSHDYAIVLSSRDQGLHIISL